MTVQNLKITLFFQSRMKVDKILWGSSIRKKTRYRTVQDRCMTVPISEPDPFWMAVHDQSKGTVILVVS